MDPVETLIRLRVNDYYTCRICDNEEDKYYTHQSVFFCELTAFLNRKPTLVTTLGDFKNATVGFYLVSEKLMNHITPFFISYMVYHSYTTYQKFKKIYLLVVEIKWFNNIFY